MKGQRASGAIALGVIAAMAGHANADLVATGSGQATSWYQFRLADVSDQVFLSQETAMNVNEPFDLAWNLDGSVHPLIDEWTSSFTGGATLDADRFELTASSIIQGTVTSPAGDGAARARTRNTIGSEWEISVTDATEATVSFDGLFADVTNDETEYEVSFNVSTLLGSFEDFSAGFNSGTQITEPFSFDTTLLAGEVITVQFVFNHLAREGAPSVTQYDEFLNATFSIVTVPAPGSVALLGLGALGAVRRRR